MFGAFGLQTLFYQTTVLSASDLIALGRVTLYSLRVISTSQAERYVQLFAAAVGPPSLGSVPQMVLQVAANGAYEWHCHGTPRLFEPGLVWAWSSTKTTDTLAPPECWLECQYLLMP